MAEDSLSADDTLGVYLQQMGAVPLLSRDEELALAQRLERARHRYRRDLSGFSTWLLTIARHVAIDYLRVRRRHEPLEAAAVVPSADHTPEQQAVRQSEAERLADLLATLEPRQRDLIAMKYGADMTNRAIAYATGLSESNVGSILHRAVETLRGRW